MEYTTTATSTNNIPTDPQLQPQSQQPIYTPQFEQGYNPEDDDDEDDDEGGRKKTKGPGRRRIEIEYITDKSRRHITFSKRKAGIMKKAYELSVLTGTEVLLLIVSESGLVYTYSTNKLQPMVVEKEGKDLIQRCLTGWSDSPPVHTSTLSPKQAPGSPSIPPSLPPSLPHASRPIVHKAPIPSAPQPQQPQPQQQQQNIPIPLELGSPTRLDGTLPPPSQAATTQIDPRLTSYRSHGTSALDFPPVQLPVAVSIGDHADYTSYLTSPTLDSGAHHALRSSPRKRKNEELGIDYPEAKRLAT